MRHFPALLGVPLMLALAACAQPGESPAGSASPLDPRSERFQQRATEVAEAWQTAPNRAAWRTGYVPLQDPTVLPTAPNFDDDTKQAFAAGWYRAQVDLPSDKPSDGTVRFPDGTLTVPLLSAAEAYRQIDQGDPPPCPGRPAAPPTPPSSPSGPDGPDSSASSACIPLTVTAVELGSVTVRTIRGDAQVPAWLYRIDELDAPVARVAVAPAAVSPAPELSVPPHQTTPELVAAQALTAVDGVELTYQLGVGACDTGITPLVQQHDDVVVIGGGITRSTGICTEQLLLKPVTVTLDAPLGTRPVLDAVTGQLLNLAVS